MSDEIKKPAPGSFSKLMSPTPPAKPETKEVEEKPGKRVTSRVHPPKRTEKERPGKIGGKKEEFKQEITKEKLQESKQELKKERDISSNIAILQARDIKALKNPVFRNQTLRFSDEELDWIRERTLELSRKLNRKVGQGDIVRIALRRIWREYELDRDKNCLIEILRKIKQ